ncbi:MAG: DNA polymerase III subunit gamma/tau [Desulfobacterales bacterium]|nr:DNA polymerase III subunit gamma/tau [Desulfobacterales bacterium]
MSYLVLARKYRPQSFEDVVEQEHVTRTLGNAIAMGRVAHAILFSGPRGTGKTTVARILAKAMNCEKGPAPTPCNQCRSCLEIASGNAVDVFEIDGASNNSVDQIRDLRENVKYMPAHSRYKIYIIDEVHMLSLAAFNALLKTLEEPPAHVMFMFATTEPNKIPVTILSRCQRHEFRRIDLESISRHMGKLCEREGIRIAAESLALISREAGGSMRDALSLLDQVASCCRQDVAYEQVLDVLGVVDRKLIFDTAAALLAGDVPVLLNIIDDVYQRGHDMKRYLADVVEHFRNLTVVRIGQSAQRVVDVPRMELDALVEQARSFSAASLSQIFELLFRETTAVKLSAQPRLAVEVAFMQIAPLRPVLPIDELIEKLDKLQKSISENQTRFPECPVSGSSHLAESTGGEFKTSVQCDAPAGSEPVDGEKGWERVVEAVSRQSSFLGASLRKGVLKKIEGDRIELEISGNGFTDNTIRREQNRAIILQTCREVFGRPIAFELLSVGPELDERVRQKEQENRLRQEALQHPLLTDVKEIFNGNVIEVKLL